MPTVHTRHTHTPTCTHTHTRMPTHVHTCTRRLVGGLDVLTEMEKVETDDKDKPLVCGLAYCMVLWIHSVCYYIGGHHYWCSLSVCRPLPGGGRGGRCSLVPRLAISGKPGNKAVVGGCIYTHWECILLCGVDKLLVLVSVERGKGERNKTKRP